MNRSLWNGQRGNATGFTNFIAIQNTASVAALLITTEVMVAELPKKPAAGPAMPPGGGMGGMDF